MLLMAYRDHQIQSQLHRAMLKQICIVILFTLFKNIRCQSVIGSTCSLVLSGDVGICRLLTECPRIREDILKKQRIPQTCGFKGTQPIVCCPLETANQIRTPGAISNQKCKQYSSFALNNCEHIIVKRIVGGVRASRYEFPHMVLIGFEAPEAIKWVCSGSLISDQFILTAASCMYSRDYGPAKYAQLGVTNINDTNRQLLNIVEHIKHPDFLPSSLYNNIGLLKLESPVNMSRAVRPACLYTKSQLPPEGVAAGWGLTSFVGEPSNDLLKVTLPTIEDGACSKHYEKIRLLKHGITKESQFCAGSTGKDTCQGDSGSPLQIEHDEDGIQCMYDIVGTSSFGKGCGSSPSVFTRVFYYLQWIEDIVWPSLSQLSLSDD